MKNKNPKIILTLCSIIVGIFIATQMKLKVESYAPITLRSIQMTKDEITSINNEIAQMKDIIELKEEELKTLKNIAKGDDDIISVLSEDLKLNKQQSGYTDLEGPGVIIKMYDNPEEQIIGADINDDVIHDLDVLTILNDLRIAGAEAISINGQRVLSMSEIKCGGPIIKVNGRSMGTPFVITAIGDSKTLIASVTAPGTYGDTLKNVFKIGFEPAEFDKVTVPAYREKFAFKYAKPLGEGD